MEVSEKIGVAPNQNMDFPFESASMTWNFTMTVAMKSVDPLVIQPDSWKSLMNGSFELGISWETLGKSSRNAGCSICK